MAAVLGKGPPGDLRAPIRLQACLTAADERTDPLIADDACARLHKASGGLPRALNNAAIAALIAAAADGKALVDDECAKKAVAELNRDRD
jgi:type II secretory pathway predicted ATPase ExeA